MGIKTGFTLHLLMVSDILQPYIYGYFVEMTSIFLLTGQVILFNHQADVFVMFFFTCGFHGNQPADPWDMMCSDLMSMHG